MSQQAVASSNVKRIAHLDLPGGGQVIVDGEASPQSNDVDVDSHGLIYLLDRNMGLDILEFEGWGARDAAARTWTDRCYGFRDRPWLFGHVAGETRTRRR